MGSVRLHAGRKALFLDFRFEGVRRREYTALSDTPANRKRLEKTLVKIEAEIEAGTFDYAATFKKSRVESVERPPGQVNTLREGAIAAVSPPTPLFRDFATRWLTEHRVEWRRSHYAILKGTVESHLVPHFGDRPIGSITKADILTFRSKLAGVAGRVNATLSNRRINGILAPLRQMLAEASDQYGFAMPMTNLKPLKVRKSDVDPFTIEQVQQILSVVRQDYRDYFIVRFFTGMRTGECHGLKWKYVDFDRRLILIRETFVLGEDEYTKTDSSQRDIQMTQLVYDALMRQHKATGKLSEYVFCNREGNPLDNKNFVHRVWQPLLRHLSLKLRRPYQMRHTAATLWLASGEAPEWIARQLGHSSSEMLFRVYSRYVPNLTRRDGSAIDRLLATRFASGASAGTDAANEEPPLAQPPPLYGRLAA
jgi:integrase